MLLGGVVGLIVCVYSPQFRSHKETKMAARRTDIYDLTEKRGTVNSLINCRNWLLTQTSTMQTIYLNQMTYTS